MIKWIKSVILQVYLANKIATYAVFLMNGRSIRLEDETTTIIRWIASEEFREQLVYHYGDDEEFTKALLNIHREAKLELKVRQQQANKKVYQ